MLNKKLKQMSNRNEFTFTLALIHINLIARNKFIYFKFSLLFCEN